jgi:hypothetical protein
MLLEPIDKEYWCEVDVLTVWQAAFAMCNIEPWDEPISSNAKPPQQIEKMRANLLGHIPHYKTNQVFSQSGWSCKTQRPAQLSGLYFSHASLLNWAKVSFSKNEIPVFLTI